MPNTSRGLSPLSIACHDMFTGLLSDLLFNLYKLTLSFDSTDNQKVSLRGLVKHSHIFVGMKEAPGGATLECKDKTYDLSHNRSTTWHMPVKDQEDTRTDVMINDGEVNTINLNTAIVDTVVSSFLDRYTTNN